MWIPCWTWSNSRTYHSLLLHCNRKIAYTQGMASLHTTIAETRTIFKWVGIGIAGLITLIIVVRYTIAVYIYFFPPPPPKPQLSYGKLPHVIFPSNVTNAHFAYALNTITGTLPVFPVIYPVYTIIEPQVSLLSYTNAQA